MATEGLLGMQKTHKQCPFKTGTHMYVTNTRSFPQFLLLTLLNLQVLTKSAYGDKKYSCVLIIWPEPVGVKID